MMNHYNNADLQFVVYVKLQSDFVFAICRIRQIATCFFCNLSYTSNCNSIFRLQLVVYVKLQLNFPLATCRIRQVVVCCESTCLSVHCCRCSTLHYLYSYFSPTSSPLHPYFCATYHSLHPPSQCADCAPSPLPTRSIRT